MTQERKKRETSAIIQVEKYTDTIDFMNSSFGQKNEHGFNSYLVHPTVSQLASNFTSFQDLVEKGNWPVSKIIQREISSDRVKEIAEQYLLSNKIKYFPPLTCVIFPVTPSNDPQEGYQEASEAQLNDAKIFFNDRVNEEGFSEPVSIFEGCYISNFDAISGKIFWDKQKCLAIMIDGQHRRQALIEAASRNSLINSWVVPVNILRVDEFCKRVGKSVSDVTRDIFLSINKTPKHVDASRIVLMDDRDLSAVFVQGLLDDEHPQVPLAPEWVDWHSEDGKFSSEFLTGVIPLYHIISFSLMNGKGLEGIEPYTNKRKVESFCEQLSNALYIPDLVAKEGLDPNSYDLEVVCRNWIRLNDSESIEDDDDNEEEGDAVNESYIDTLFSLEPEVMEKFQARFLNMYGPIFKKVYSEFGPYKKHLEILNSKGLRSPNSKLKKHLRSTLEVKQRNRKERWVEIVIEDVEKNKEGEIFHTVMGQKALFKFIFNSIIKTQGVNSENFHEQAKLKVNSLIALEKLFSENDSDFFNFNHKLKVPRDWENEASKKILTNFWEGIILKQTSEIDYSKSAINCLVNILETLEKWKSNDENETIPSYKKTFIKRHVSILSKTIDGRVNLETLAEKIVEVKIAHLQKLYSKISG